MRLIFEPLYRLLAGQVVDRAVVRAFLDARCVLRLLPGRRQ
jgi:hypothetical protein